MKPSQSAMCRCQPDVGRAAACLLSAALGWALCAAPAVADDVAPALAIELNKLEDSEQGCRSIFVLDNRTGHELSRFRLDLVLFDDEGVYSKQLLLDLAPLYDDKKTVASFVLHEQPCAELGSVLVNDVPWCENGAGAALDCVPMLEVSSLAEVPLHK